MLFCKIARGLERIHNCNIIHGDLKPENILIDDSENVIIVDFYNMKGKMPLFCTEEYQSPQIVRCL